MCAFSFVFVFINEDKEDSRRKTVENWGKYIKSKQKMLWETLWASGGQAVVQMWGKIRETGKMPFIHKASPTHPAVFPVCRKAAK